MVRDAWEAAAKNKNKNPVARMNVTAPKFLSDAET
jgi:hypothetical protein